MVRVLNILMALFVLSACASSPRAAPDASLALPRDTQYTDVLPDGPVLATFTSALGLPCQRIDGADGDVIACEGPGGWLVVDDHTPSSSAQ